MRRGEITRKKEMPKEQPKEKEIAVEKDEKPTQEKTIGLLEQIKTNIENLFNKQNDRIGEIEKALKELQTQKSDQQIREEMKAKIEKY